MGYSFDESGVTFYYFLISVLGLVLVPVTLSPIFSQKDVFKNDVRATKKYVRKQKNGISFKWLLIALGWAALSAFTYRVMTTDVSNNKIWDPYSILNIQEGITEKQIKNVYRKLSLKYHPDKVRGVSEEEAVVLNDKYVEITKAYKALTDAEIRKNYEEFGHPDGRQSLSVGIALPAWLVEAHNNFWVLSVYGAILGFLMPFYVGKWWYRSLKYTRDRILNRTMALYFKELRDNILMKELVELISASKEFDDEIEYKPDDEEEVQLLWKVVKEEAEKNGIILEESRKFDSKFSLKASALIQAHLNRVKVTNTSLYEDQQEIVSRASSLVHGLTQIALTQNSIHTTMLCTELSQMIVQAVPYKASPLLQLPHVNNEIIRSARGKKNLKNVSDFMKLEEKERRNLLSVLTDVQYKETTQAGLKFPVLILNKAYIKVIGDEIITPSALLTCVVKLRLSTVEETLSNAASEGKTVEPEVEDSLVDDEDSHVRSFLSKASSSHLVPPVYAPYFPEDKRCNWWVVIGDVNSGRMLINPSKVPDLVDETLLKFQFQGPPEPGSYSFNLFIKSDCYLGCDIREELNFTVEPDTALPEESEVDDDISEPEDNSMAAQMDQMRAGDGKAPVVLNDDMTSSDEDN